MKTDEPDLDRHDIPLVSTPKLCGRETQTFCGLSLFTQIRLRGRNGALLRVPHEKRART